MILLYLLFFTGAIWFTSKQKNKSLDINIDILQHQLNLYETHMKFIEH